MRILYIHQHFSTPRGAFGTRSYEFACRLVAAGHQVIVVCGASSRSVTGLEAPFVNGRREGLVDGINVIEYDIGYSTGDGVARRIAKFTRFGLEASKIALTTSYDLIFATSTPLTAAIPGVLAKCFRRKPFVFEVRDLWPELPRALGVTNPVLLGGMGALEWTAYRSADHVVGLAPGIVDGIARHGIDRDRISLIANGCDVALFQDRPDDTPAPSWPVGVEPGDFVAVYSGAHGIANGLDALIPVAEELRARGCEGIKLVLIGNGATKDALVKEVQSRGLKSIVFGDLVPKTDLVRLLKRADAGLQLLKNVTAFYRGTSPNKFFDYIAAGIPVIVNYPGWIAELVEDNACGSVVPPDDPVAFADALMRARDQGDGWRALGTNSNRLAKENFSRDRLGATFLDVIETVGSK
mgnify:CR=1 FL=1